MFYRIYPSKDTYITNYQLRNIQRTGSNFGASEILHLHKLCGVSGSAGVSASSSFAHILTRFDIGEIESLIASGEAQYGNIRFFLKMSDARHDQTLPTSFDVEVQALDKDWDEGKGRDVDSFSDLGVANWVKAKSNVYWTSPGGDTVGVIANTHFDDGHEDLEVEVTDIVQQWISYNVNNNGVMIKISSSQEADNNDYYVKMFHGRETFFKDKRPHLEARWDNSERDDRNNFFFDVSGTLYLNHLERGQFTNIPQVGTGQLGVKIIDVSGSLISHVTASWTGFTGRYSASFAIPSGTYSGSLFTDVWHDISNSSRWFMSGTFPISDSLNVTSVQPKRYYATVTNLKSTYENDEVVRMNLFIRPHDYSPARVLTASLDANGIVITKAYYRIINDRTDEVVVPFGTGSLEYTRLSYDQRGNSFKIYMNSLSPGNVYRLSFLFDVDGQRQYIDQQGFKFKVV